MTRVKSRVLYRGHAADLSLEQGRGDPGARGALSILPATPEAERAVGRPSVKVGALPFRIGRRDRGLTSSVFSLNDLTLSNDPPYQVSRNHCSIDLNPAGGFLVQDRGSTLGTSVNGVRIGTGARRTEAPLDRETNVLALGNASSPYRFEVVFSPRARSA